MLLVGKNVLLKENKLGMLCVFYVVIFVYFDVLRDMFFVRVVVIFG